MAKQISIKEIARMAGVSPGTVDRIIHNRGNVSAKRRVAVEEALKQAGYKPNIHTSAVSYRKELKIVVTTPLSVPGDYWDKVSMGFDEALTEFADIDITCSRCPYDQFDESSCKNTFSQVLEMQADAVVIGPTFENMTRDFCNALDSKGIPYVFVDATIDGTSPRASFTTDQKACGELIGRLATSTGGSIAILSSRRKGLQHSRNSELREEGLSSYIKGKGIETVIKRCVFTATDQEKARVELTEFFLSNPDIVAAAVMNSRGYIVADTLKGCKELSGRGIRLYSFELTDQNRRCLEDDSIDALLCQRPSDQGYNAIHYLMKMFIYNVGPLEESQLMPVDIVFKESLPCYRESARQM